MGKDSSPQHCGVRERWERESDGPQPCCWGSDLGLRKFDGMFGWCWLFVHVVCLYGLSLFNLLFQNYDGRQTLREVIMSADTHLPLVSVDDCSTIKEKGSKKNHYVQMMICGFVQAFTGLLFVRDLY
jgi:hypothetical protein